MVGLRRHSLATNKIDPAPSGRVYLSSFDKIGSFQIPHAVDVALHNRAERPRLDHPPLRIFWFSGPAWSEGVETHQLDDVPVRIYGPEKSIADSFKYRRKLGLDIALEALKLYRQRGTIDVGKLLYYARTCRVERVMRPYLEALL